MVSWVTAMQLAELMPKKKTNICAARSGMPIFTRMGAVMVDIMT